MNIDRDRLLQENEDESRRIKEELIALREAMLRSENALNVLAIERTNLESSPGEARIEIPTELQAFIPTNEKANVRRIWPKVAVGAVVLAAILLGLSDLGMFDSDGSTSVARGVCLLHLLLLPRLRQAKELKQRPLRLIRFHYPTNPNSVSDKINSVPNEVPMNILPGITYTSEISYSMKSSVITLVKVQDAPQITLHLNHAPQSFFIPMKTAFRIDSDAIGIDQSNGRLMVLADSKRHDLEILFERNRIPLERKILGVSSSQ